MCNFINGSLSELSKNLNDKNKFITKEHFPDNFELLKYKTCFPYEFITKENIYNKELPSIENFYSSLKLDNITKEDYDKTLEIYKKLNCKNIKEYLDIYLKLDICLQADIFNVFRKTIWDKFEIDCSKYITSCSLSFNLKENYKSSEKLITHLGYDKNCYISNEMYEMISSLGYEIKIKKILEYKHSNFMKPYIDFLFEKKSYYKKIMILE